MSLREPEQATQPPEISAALQHTYQSTYDLAFNEHFALVRRRVPQILNSHTGTLPGISSEGRRVEFDAGDIWELLTDDQKSAELALLAANALGDSPAAAIEAGAFMRGLIDAFATRQADLIALREAQQALDDEARAA